MKLKIAILEKSMNGMFNRFCTFFMENVIAIFVFTDVTRSNLALCNHYT
jgi:hypothetical protein